jgi:hypothetical protein
MGSDFSLNGFDRMKQEINNSTEINKSRARLICLAHAQAGNENGDREVFKDEEWWKFV